MNHSVRKKTILSGFILLSITILVMLAEACSPDLNTNKTDISAYENQQIPEVVDFIFHVKPILSDRCFKCHGPDENKIEGDLQLHSEEKAFAALGKDKDRWALVANHPEKSSLIDRIYSNDPDDLMPPPESNLSLDEREKAIIKRWIEQGAEWKEHWAFVRPTAPGIPEVSNPSWPINEIDHFILAKLDEHKLNTTKAIRSEKLLRKLSFDLRGIPPTLAEINSFLEDNSEENYQRFVDQFLDSDAYAERMTSEWLDLARYADTHGYQDDLERTMWPWRDWVIHAFKENMPYDQFVIWQLAGDLLPNASKEQIIATAFNRNHKITQEGGVIPEEYRAEYVTDRANTFGTAFLGLTFECAKCHDHKYDPISQKEYFQLFSYFNSVDEKGLIEEYGAIPEPYITITKEEIASTLQFINNLDTLDNIPLLVMEDLAKPRKTHILNRGVYDQKADEVFPNVPSFGKAPVETSSNDRLQLAEWLFEKENPLTARVMVNRLWQQIYGKGIVSSSYDFGNQGSLPTHPELLDHLAVKFRKDGWDIKKMMKYIVSSATYRQDSKVDDRLLEYDPSNRWFARSPRVRLSAEMLRDHALSISGLLVPEVGGPSVKPYQPEGLWQAVTGGGGGSTARYVQDKGDNNYRRSIYTFWKRTVPPPNMLLFDTPTRDFCMVKREHTSTPLQALVLMNDPQFLECSVNLANNAMKNNVKLAEDNGAQEIDIKEAIQTMFMLATSRKATDEELSSLQEMYQEELGIYEDNISTADALLQFGKFQHEEKKEELAALSLVANTIFNIDETIRKS